MHKLDWDDLRYILAVANAGSLAGAARDLGVNHTTVLRRINAFEETRGLRLFERLPSGYTLTPGGEQLLAAARAMAGVVDDLERKLSGQDLRLEGIIRVTTTDTLMASVLPPMLARFAAAHPGITLEILTGNTIANLTRRDADVAIRTVGAPPDTLVGRKVTAIAWALYAGPDYPVTHDLEEAAWIAPDDSLSASAYARWLKVARPKARIAARADSFVAMARLAEHGIGIVALPFYLGAAFPLVRLGGPLPDLENELWVLTHEDLRRTSRIAAFTAFMGHEIAAARSLFLGGTAD
jgi:DNA-binding transcriptional LysR family regulator